MWITWDIHGIPSAYSTFAMENSPLNSIMCDDLPTIYRHDDFPYLPGITRSLEGESSHKDSMLFWAFPGHFDLQKCPM